MGVPLLLELVAERVGGEGEYLQFSPKIPSAPSTSCTCIIPTLTARIHNRG